MLAREKQQVESYERVQDFLKAHPAPEGRTYGRGQALLDDVVTELAAHRIGQVGGGRLSKAERRREKALQRSLRELHLGPISKIAKATLAESPGIEKALKMPEPQLSTTELLDQAGAMRDAAALYAPTFAENGLPANFLELLDEAIEQLRGAMLGKARNVGTKAGARAGIAQEIKRGRSAVQMLDAAVSTLYAGDRDFLARWRMAKRVRAFPGGGTPAPATGGTADENLAPDTAQEGA